MTGQQWVGTAFLRNPPAGYQAPRRAPQSGAAPYRIACDYSTSEMLQTRSFYAIWIAYCLGITAGLMVISQLVPFARSAGLSMAGGTLAVTVGAFGNASGRIVSGWLSDTFGRLATLRTVLFVSAVAMPVWFSARQEAGLFYVLSVVIYWCYGT